MALSCTGGGSGWILKKFLLRVLQWHGLPWEVESLSLEVVQETCECGTEVHG